MGWMVRWASLEAHQQDLERNSCTKSYIATPTDDKLVEVLGIPVVKLRTSFLDWGRESKVAQKLPVPRSMFIHSAMYIRGMI